MNRIFEKGEVPSDFRQTLTKIFCKTGDKSERGNYKGISLVSVGGKLLSMIIPFRLKNVVYKVLTVEQCGLRFG